MTKRKKTVTVLVIAIILLVVITACVLWKLSPARYASNKVDEMWNKSVAIQNHSKFIISGKIVDSNGQPVDQVKVYISKSYFINPGQNRFEESVQTVNSDFKLELSGGSDVSLRFHKEGYYSVANVQYKLPLSKKIWGFSSNVVVSENQKIVLERTGTLAKYKETSPGFFIEGEQKFTCYSIPLLKTDYDKKYFFADIPNLPLGTIYPDVERDKDGKIIKIVIDKAGDKRLWPQTVSLNMTGGDNDGFVMLEKTPPRGMIGIKEAPETGYVKQMVFHFPENINKIFYFYYKFGNCYGKGVANSFGCSASGEIMIGLDLSQNNETSSDPQVRRNLRTRQ